MFNFFAIDFNSCHLYNYMNHKSIDYSDYIYHIILKSFDVNNDLKVYKFNL